LGLGPKEFSEPNKPLLPTFPSLYFSQNILSGTSSPFFKAPSGFKARKRRAVEDLKQLVHKMYLRYITLF
jgi:hypothetical protein